MESNSAPLGFLETHLELRHRIKVSINSRITKNKTAKLEQSWLDLGYILFFVFVNIFGKIREF